MVIKHQGLEKINGPLIVVKGVIDAGFEELVQIEMGNDGVRADRVVRPY